MFAAMNAQALATDTDGARLLASELPSGVTLKVASMEQILAATRVVVRLEPRRTRSVVRAAILAKAPRRPVESKNVVDRSKETICPPCDYILDVVRTAILANPEEANAIIEEASSLCPSCAGDLQALVNDPGVALGGEDDYRRDIFGIGVGLGPGFPVAPVVVTTEQPTGGILSLPPVGNPVTSVVNR